MTQQSFRGWIEQFIGNSELANMFYTGQCPQTDNVEELRAFFDAKHKNLLSEFNEKYADYEQELKNYKPRPASLNLRFTGLLSAEGWCAIFEVNGAFKYKPVTMFALTDSGKTIGLVMEQNSAWFLPVDQVSDAVFNRYCRQGEVETLLSRLQKEKEQ